MKTKISISIKKGDTPDLTLYNFIQADELEQNKFKSGNEIMVKKYIREPISMDIFSELGLEDLSQIVYLIVYVDNKNYDNQAFNPYTFTIYVGEDDSQIILGKFSQFVLSNCVIMDKMQLTMDNPDSNTKLSLTIIVGLK